MRDLTILPMAAQMLVIPGYISCAFQAGIELGRKQMALEMMLKGADDVDA